MTTVREAALRLERGDVVESLIEPVGGNPEVELSHARVVHDHAAAREDDELSPGGGMPARAVRAHGAGRQEILAGEGVDEGGLPHAGRAEEGGRHSGAEVRANVDEARPGANRDSVHGNPEPGQFGRRLVDVGDQVGLREEQHRSRPTLPRQGEVAVEERLAEPVPERGDDEHHVDVGCNDLLTHIVGARLVGGAA